MGRLNKNGEHIMTCNCHFTANKAEYVRGASYETLERKLAKAVEQRNELRNAFSKHHGLNQADTMYAVERLDAELESVK